MEKPYKIKLTYDILDIKKSIINKKIFLREKQYQMRIGEIWSELIGNYDGFIYKKEKYRIFKIINGRLYNTTNHVAYLIKNYLLYMDNVLKIIGVSVLTLSHLCSKFHNIL